MRKYLAWAGVLLSLIIIVQSLMLGISYYSEGYGLHPLICGALSVFAAFGGWWMAGWAERCEADELEC